MSTAREVLKENDYLYVKKVSGNYAKLFTEGYIYKVEVGEYGFTIKDDNGDEDYMLIAEYLDNHLVKINDENGSIKASKAGIVHMAKAAMRMKMQKIKKEKAAETGATPLRKKPGPKPKTEN
jgi:hypothetical protein